MRTEAVQNEAIEAVQIEKQALVPEHVNQYVSGTHLPATAWPRQMLAVFYDPPLAGSSGWLYNPSDYLTPVRCVFFCGEVGGHSPRPRDN